MARRPGRPAALAFDDTRFDGPAVNVRARIGWLLRVNRLASSDPDNRSLTRFAKRLRSAGVVCDNPRVSGWESAQSAIPLWVVDEYESLLSLRPGHLRSVCVCLHAALSPTETARSVRRHVAPTHVRSPQSDLDAAYGRITEHTPTGADWLALTDLLTGTGEMFLPRQIVESLSAQLLSELMRSVGTAYSARITALTDLIAHRPLAASVTKSIHTVVREPGVQGVVDPLSILGEVTNRQLIQSLLASMVNADSSLRDEAGQTLLSLLSTHEFPETSLADLHRMLVNLVADGNDSGTQAWARTLDAYLPPASRPLAGAHAPTIHRHAAARSADTTATSERDRLVEFAEAGQRSTGLATDPMYLRLIDEALFSTHPTRRHHASLLLVASPYRSATAEVAADWTESSDSTSTRAAAATLLGYVSGAEQEPVLQRWLASDRVDLRRAALTALAHGQGLDPTTDLNAMRHAGGVSEDTLTYAAGMTAHPVLHAWAGDETAPGAMRHRARWWLTHGPAVRDDHTTIQPA